MLRRHLNSTVGETVGLTDNAVVDRTGAKCTALFSSGSLHIGLSAREMVDNCMCVDVTLTLTRVKKNHDDKRTVTTEHTGTIIGLLYTDWSRHECSKILDRRIRPIRYLVDHVFSNVHLKLQLSFIVPVVKMVNHVTGCR